MLKAIKFPVPEVVPVHQWCCEHAPEAEMCSVFIVGLPPVPHFQHIGVIPMSRASIPFKTDLLIKDL